MARRQFTHIEGLLKGTHEADYDACVDIVTKGALRQMIAPGLLAIVSPTSLASMAPVKGEPNRSWRPVVMVDSIFPPVPMSYPVPHRYWQTEHRTRRPIWNK